MILYIFSEKKALIPFDFNRYDKMTEIFMYMCNSNSYIQYFDSILKALFWHFIKKKNCSCLSLSI